MDECYFRVLSREVVWLCVGVTLDFVPVSRNHAGVTVFTLKQSIDLTVCIQYYFESVCNTCTIRNMIGLFATSWPQSNS